MRLSGERLRAERVRAGYTQAQLGHYADLSEKTVRRLEAGQNTPHLDTVGRLATALGVPATALLAPEETGVPT